MTDQQRTFVCDLCGRTFPVDGRTQEQRDAECLSYFGEVPVGEDKGVVCDECWSKIHPQRN